METTRSDRAVRPRRAAEGTAFANRVRSALEALAGRTITLSLLLPAAVTGPRGLAGGTVVARYACADGSPDRFLIADMPAMACLGGARAMLSHGAVTDALDAERWPESLLDNCFDVLQQVAGIWSRDDREVDLAAVHGFLDDEPLPAELTGVLDGASRRLEAELTVAGYGTGRIALLRA